jgi:hypothetical protein
MTDLNIKRVLITKTNAANKRVRGRFVIYAADKYDARVVFGCAKDGTGGWFRKGMSEGNLAVSAWPEIVRSFLVDRLMAAPKPKPPVDKSAKLAQRRAAAVAKLAEWTRKSTAATGRMRKYAKQLANIERQIAAQQTAGLAGAGRSFSFDE